MGGIAIMIALLILSGFLYYEYRGSEPVVAKNLVILTITTIGFGIIGFIDDFKKVVLGNTKGLKPSYKMLGLLVVATTFTIYLINAH